MLRRGWGFGQKLAGLGALGLVVRLAFAVYQRQRLPFPFSDATKYAGLANGIAHGKWFVDPFLGTPTADHSPLYAVYLSVAGLVRHHQATEFQFIVWTCFLGTASVVLVGLAGREIAGPRIGLIAAGVAAIDPGMWVYDGLLLSESMAIFTVSGIILFAYRLWRKPSLSRVLWLGLWCGLATLARSELALSVPLLLVPLSLRAVAVDWKRRILWIVAGGVVAALVITPWIVFNQDRFKEPVLLTTNFGRTMAAAKCHDGYYGQFLGAQSYDCLNRDQKLVKGLDESQADKVYRRLATDYVKAHPSRTVVEVAAAWARTFGIYKPTQELGYTFTRQTKGKPVSWLVMLSFYAFFVAAIYGAIVLRRRKIPVYPLVAFWVMILFSVTLTFAQERYRAIGEPTLVLLAAAAIDQLFWRTQAIVPARKAPTSGNLPPTTSANQPGT